MVGSSPFTSRFDVRRRRRQCRDEEDDVFATRATFVGPNRHATTEEKPVEDDVLRDDGCPFVVVLLVLLLL